MEIFFQSTHSQKELLFPTVRVSKETEDLSPELPVLPLSSLVTPMMPRRPESDFHQEPERPSSVLAELWLVSAPVDRELISHYSRQTEPGSRLRERESTGQELEVSQ